MYCTDAHHFRAHDLIGVVQVSGAAVLINEAMKAVRTQNTKVFQLVLRRQDVDIFGTVVETDGLRAHSAVMAAAEVEGVEASTELAPNVPVELLLPHHEAHAVGSKRDS